MIDWTTVFDHRDGRIFWRADPAKPKAWNTRYAGTRAGSLRLDGYRRVTVGGRKFYEHCLIFELCVGPIPAGFDVDHINMDRADNRPANLRLASRSQNKANGRRYTSNSVGAKGVTYHKRRRKFQVAVGGHANRRHVGTFASVTEAADAYERAAAEHYGAFSRSE